MRRESKIIVLILTFPFFSAIMAVYLVGFVPVVPLTGVGDLPGAFSFYRLRNFFMP